MKAGLLRGRSPVTLAAASLLTAALAACGGGSSAGSAASTAASTSAGGTASVTGTSQGGTAASARPDHVVVVVMENHAYGDVVGKGSAPWVNHLPAAVLTNWFAVAHPSQPNYIALFSGSTQGVRDDSCPQRFDAPNLGRQLLSAGFTFTGYAEALPHPGDGVCRTGRYARKHAPWTDFSNLPASVGQPFSAFPSDFDRLPTVAFVIPDMCHDTHDCSVQVGDSWLSTRLGTYATWARVHNSLLIITYDEDDRGAGNHILTLVVGAGVKPGRYDVRGDHYTLLATVEAMYGLPALGAAAGRASIRPVWS